MSFEVSKKIIAPAIALGLVLSGCVEDKSTEQPATNKPYPTEAPETTDYNEREARRNLCIGLLSTEAALKRDTEPNATSLKEGLINLAATQAIDATVILEIEEAVRVARSPLPSTHFGHQQQLAEVADAFQAACQ